MAIELSHDDTRVFIPSETKEAPGIELSMPAMKLRSDPDPEGRRKGWVEFFADDQELNLSGQPVNVRIRAMANQSPVKGEVAFLSLIGPQKASLFSLPALFGADRLFHSISWHGDAEGNLTTVTGEYPMHNECTGAGYVSARKGDDGQWQISCDHDYRTKRSW